MRNNDPMIINPAERLKAVQAYYFAGKLAEVREMNARGLQVINLGIGDPDQAPAAEVINALTGHAQQAQNHGYQPYRGTAGLREAIAVWYKKVYGVSLSVDEEILPLNGSKEGIFHISMAFLNAGDEVLIPNPGYPAYSAAAQLAGARAVTYNLEAANGWLPNLDHLKTMNLSKVKIMWINYPHMPTGAVASAELFEKLAIFCFENQIVLVNDNPYSLVLNEHNPLSLLKLKDRFSNCLELNSFSKSFNMAGWRVGMVLGGQPYIDAILRVKSNIDSGTFLPVQKAAIAALQTSQTWHEERNALYGRRKVLAEQLLKVLDCSFETNRAGMFVWGKMEGSEKDSAIFIDKILHKARVFITPGKIFGSNGEGYVRISLCASEAEISNAIERVKAAGIFHQKSSIVKTQ